LFSNKFSLKSSIKLTNGKVENFPTIKKVKQSKKAQATVVEIKITRISFHFKIGTFLRFQVFIRPRMKHYK
jgi:hypothetical protein